jgi:hypothetical protein
VTELERQGVGQKVVADMFGLALRSYQQKVQRLSESATDQGTTLWEAVYRHIQEKNAVSRADILLRFARDDVATVRGVLHDLVGTGLVYKTGRGDATAYRAAPEEELGRAFAARDRTAEAALVWVKVYRDGPIERAGLLDGLRIQPERLDGALEQLLAEGRVIAEAGSYRAESCVIPLGDPAGWEAALLDHYQSIVGAMCAKLASLGGPPAKAAHVGGSTLSFDVWPGHPHAERVYGLLASTRKELIALWEEVHAHNEKVGRPPRHENVTFYFGQNVREGSNGGED